MGKYIILAVFVIGIFCNFSADQKVTKNHDYVGVIRKCIEKLNVDPNDHRAGKTLIQTYSQAIVYYQKEIDQILTSNDQLKWKKTLDIMLLNNEMSEEIRYNSSALRLVCDPKIYTSELPDVRQHAIDEMYEVGVSLLVQPSRAKVKEAYDMFNLVAKFDPKYKDVGKKIQETRERATIKVIVEQVAAYSPYKNLFSKKFYQTMLYKLQENFLYDKFVILCTPEEAKRRNIAKPDMIILVSFIDFQVDNVTSFFESQQINTSGIIEMKIFSDVENKEIMNKRLPGQYIWQNYNSGKGTDLQGLFDSFSLSMCDEVVDRISLFMTQYD